jgi:hypothetical protein
VEEILRIDVTRFCADGRVWSKCLRAREKSKMITGIPNARAVHFSLDSTSVAPNLIGDGLLPADIDGKVQPTDTAAIPIMGVQDDGGPFGATFDALNIWDLRIQWPTIPLSSLVFRTSLRLSPFDSIFPCGVVRGSQRPDARDCLPQPGITDGSRFLDILSYRQRLMFRLAYRKFGTYESMVTNQSVEARPGIAGVRWYEIRRTMVNTPSSNRAPMLQLTGCIAGWAASPRTNSETWLSATVWSMEQCLSGNTLHRAHERGR